MPAALHIACSRAWVPESSPRLINKDSLPAIPFERLSHRRGPFDPSRIGARAEQDEVVVHHHPSRDAVAGSHELSFRIRRVD